MKLFLSTPILRTLVRHLNKLDNKLAESIVKADNFIKASPELRELFNSEHADELRVLRPFLRDELIKKTIQECVAKEQHRRSLPAPGNIHTWTENWYEKKIPLSTGHDLYLHVSKGRQVSDKSTKPTKV